MPLQQTDEGEQAKKAADNAEALEPGKGAEPSDAAPPVDGAKPPSPLREVKDEVVEEAPGAQVKEEEDVPQGLPPAEPPRLPNQHLAGERIGWTVLCCRRRKWRLDTGLPCPLLAFAEDAVEW